MRLFLCLVNPNVLDVDSSDAADTDNGTVVITPMATGMSSLVLSSARNIPQFPARNMSCSQPLCNPTQGNGLER